ncbi:hypothetical protein, partial [Aeromonas caviae]|uniref:hypothetical protein n=1 Tax=Aeromonas caviae TaxID=648 RepID=UPI001CC532C1
CVALAQVAALERHSGHLEGKAVHAPGAGEVCPDAYACTGRMNGFSFEVAGVPFKGSDLGKGYTWAGLQKSGVT